MNRRIAYALLMGLAAPSLAMAQTATEPAATTTPAAEAPAAATPAPAATAEADRATMPDADVLAEELSGNLDAMEEVEIGKTRYVTEQSETSLFSSDMVGAAVYGIDAEKIGDINDLMLAGDGSVEAVVIGVGGFLGLGEKDVAVPLDTLDIALVDGDYRITIPATERDLFDAPSFARSDGTSSDRLGEFERTYEKARAEAEAAYESARERASELYDNASKEAGELSVRAQDEANRLIERGRAAVNELKADAETSDGAETDATVTVKPAGEANVTVKQADETPATPAAQ
ncbi:PRC-barrel domain-containing protein [Acuticoccus sp. MNP-M23]|uniref:PRC-barrel domain-containing protein n=1 Tax=Acuticoccus sp. MNP-M23 TaxID=3072793 RepID=UPI002814F3BA|nr:PRC-barrel domain-containing protein [Acuticoccus sp. MNP-M23]WMS43339.1 PRC-barrel domain-containing protein [Acuticoccus sp. MNP-M23]